MKYSPISAGPTIREQRLAAEREGRILKDERGNPYPPLSSERIVPTEFALGVIHSAIGVLFAFSAFVTFFWVVYAAASVLSFNWKEFPLITAPVVTFFLWIADKLMQKYRGGKEAKHKSFEELLGTSLATVIAVFLVLRLS